MRSETRFNLCLAAICGLLLSAFMGQQAVIAQLKPLGDSTIKVTDAQRQFERSEAIKKTLLAKFKACPKLLAIPSLPPAGVQAQYQLWIKEPVAAGNKDIRSNPPAANQDNGGQVRGRVVRGKSLAPHSK